MEQATVDLLINKVKNINKTIYALLSFYFIFQASVRAEPSALQFSEMKSDEKSPREENTVNQLLL